MLFNSNFIKNDELDSVVNFFSEFDSQEDTAPNQDVQEASSVSQYISSLVSSCYQKSIDDIANTKIGNRLTRKKNFQQVMKESFFYGANRFGNNFIA